MEAEILALVEKQLTAYRPQQIRATLEMLDEGNTVPFIARYRKERTHSLDEVQIREIQAAYHQTETLEKRKTEVLKQIEEQGKLTTGLKQQIKQAATLTKAAHKSDDCQRSGTRTVSGVGFNFPPTRTTRTLGGCR